MNLLFRLIFAFSVSAILAQPAAVSAQEADRAATGGAQTLADILARQKGDAVDDEFRRTNTGDPLAGPGAAALGTLGGASDPELWRALRYGSADVTSSSSTPGATLLVQDGGMSWLAWREGPLRLIGGSALGIMLILLTIFYLTRDRIMIEHGAAGTKIERFKPIERFGHWLLAGSFILLGITGLITLFGRTLLIPMIGKDAFGPVALASKWIHNNVAWAFMLGLVMVLVMWVIHNLPSRTDIKWIMQGGGIFTKAHPPAKKFNAGQKLIFWSVIILGISVSASGLALLFPFELPMFAKTFVILNDWGAHAWIGRETPFPTELTPHQEMQYAQGWHAIVAFAMMVIIVAHIYIGSIGMEGAFDAMGDGHVDLNWAKEHHSIWAEDVLRRNGAAPDLKSPAE